MYNRAALQVRVVNYFILLILLIFYFIFIYFLFINLFLFYLFLFFINFKILQSKCFNDSLN